MPSCSSLSFAMIHSASSCLSHIIKDFLAFNRRLEGFQGPFHQTAPQGFFTCDF
jgi:hypothetical protein